MTKTYNVFTGDGQTIATEETIASLAAAITGSSITGSGPAASGSLTTLANVQDSNNTNLSTLASGSTWSGSWTDCTGYSQIVTNFRSTKSGSFSMLFSSDGVTADRTLGPYSLAANTDSPQPLAPIRRYYKAQFQNLTADEAQLRIETRLSSVPGIFQTRLADSMSTLSPAILNRSVIFGLDSNQTTYKAVGVTQGNALRAHLEDPLTAFGDLITAQLEPRVQIDAVYGILSSDHEALSASNGTVVASGGQFVLSTGTSVGGYGVLRSRKLIRYRPGQGMRMRLTAQFSGSAANSIQLAGGFTSTEALCFGYSGTQFGILRRIAGAATIARLTVSAGATGAETATVTLNGTAFTASIASGSTSFTAEQIGENGVYTGWSSIVSPTSNGATVTWIQATPGAATGSYTLTSTGTATGSFEIIQSGSANDDATGFVAQEDWNIDVMDGSNSINNPSGILLDTSKLNIYEVSLAYLGAGAVTFYIRTPDGGHQEVHRIEYPNSATIPNMRNPTMRLGWIAASLGSTTNLVVKGASAAGFIEGPLKTLREPIGTAVNGFSTGTTEYVALAVRVGSVFGGIVNNREFTPSLVTVGTETSNRTVRVRLVLNPTMSGVVNWGWVNSSRSGLEVATPASSPGIVATSGADVAYLICASGSPSVLDLSDSGLRLVPGDVLAICLQGTGAATTSVSINGNDS